MTTITADTQKSQYQIYDEFAKHLTTKYGYCVDLTSETSTPQLYQPISNRKNNPKQVIYEWDKYSHKNKIVIPKQDYANFRRELIDGVMGKLPLISGTGFHAGKDPFFTYNGALIANKYQPFMPDTTGISINPIFYEYIERLFENKQDEQVVLDWCADIIQNPSRKPMWGLLITGDQGCGKSRLPELVKLALGGLHCFIEAEYLATLDTFSETFADNLLVAYDDPSTNNHKAYEKLKLRFVQTDMEIQHKKEQIRFNRPSMSRIMMLHNSERPWVFPPSDRRLYVPQRMTHLNKHNPKGCETNSAAFFERFIDWQESSQAPIELYKFFKERDLSKFKHGSTTKTEQHQKMAMLSTSVLDNLIASFLEEGEQYRFHVNELLAYLKNNGVQFPNLDSIKLKLTERAYEHKRRVTATDPKEVRVWVWQPITQTRSPSLTSAEVNRICSSEGSTF